MVVWPHVSVWDKIHFIWLYRPQSQRNKILVYTGWLSFIIMIIIIMFIAQKCVSPSCLPTTCELYSSGACLNRVDIDDMILARLVNQLEVCVFLLKVTLSRTIARSVDRLNSVSAGLFQKPSDDADPASRDRHGVTPFSLSTYRDDICLTYEYDLTCRPDGVCTAVSARRQLTVRGTFISRGTYQPWTGQWGSTPLPLPPSLPPVPGS